MNVRLKYFFVLIFLMSGITTYVKADNNLLKPVVDTTSSKTEIFTFTSNGKKMQGKIYLPPSYCINKSLPAVYLIDFTEQHFKLATDEYEKVIDGVNQLNGFNALVVSLNGIPNIDVEPNNFEEHYSIFEDMSSYVASKYTENPSRTFIGKGSEAGVVLMALFLDNRKKSVFNNFIVTDPSPKYVSAIIDLIKKDSFPKNKSTKKLHFSFSTSNDRAKCIGLIDMIKDANYKWLQFESKEYSNSDYENTYPVSFAEGIKYVFKENKIKHSELTMNNMYQPIEFESQNATLRGRLYVPKDSDSLPPVIIMAHGFTTTISGMTADKYAEEFQNAGFAVLLYDHRNLGISGGEPRHEINFWVQSRGYIDAIGFISKQPEIDANKIAVWGASLSSREAFLVGTMDYRVKAVIAMIPAFGEEIPKEDEDGSLYAFAKETLLMDDIKSLPQTTTEQIPIVSTDQKGTPSALKNLTAYNWFIEHGGRFGTHWKNVVSFSRIETPENLNVGQFTNKLKAPILMVVATNDEMNGANPQVTKFVYDNIKQPKEWVDIEGGHFGLLYYPSELFNQSSRAQINFLMKYLK